MSLSHRCPFSATASLLSLLSLRHFCGYCTTVLSVSLHHSPRYSPLRHYPRYSATTTLMSLICTYITVLANLPLRHCCCYSATTSLLSLFCHSSALTGPSSAFLRYLISRARNLKLLNFYFQALFAHFKYFASFIV